MFPARFCWSHPHLGRVRRNTVRLVQAIGVDPDERGLLNVDDYYRTAQSGVYACGDVIGYPALASTSMEQGVRAAHHMWSDEVRPRIRSDGIIFLSGVGRRRLSLGFALDRTHLALVCVVARGFDLTCSDVVLTRITRLMHLLPNGYHAGSLRDTPHPNLGGRSRRRWTTGC